MYIPDLTERFPEGFGGIDMTPSYFGEPVDWSRAYGEEYEEENYEDAPTEPRKFEVGKEYEDIGLFGGITYYTVKEIDRENNKILLSEVWYDVDGSGTRKAKWHRLETDEYGNDKAFNYYSESYDLEVWIYA